MYWLEFSFLDLVVVVTYKTRNNILYFEAAVVYCFSPISKTSLKWEENSPTLLQNIGTRISCINFTVRIPRFDFRLKFQRRYFGSHILATFL